LPLPPCTTSSCPAAARSLRSQLQQQKQHTLLVLGNRGHAPAGAHVAIAHSCTYALAREMQAYKCFPYFQGNLFHIRQFSWMCKTAAAVNAQRPDIDCPARYRLAAVQGLPANAVSARLLRPCRADGGSWMMSLQDEGCREQQR
jgi:hypothetical protein